MSKVGSEEILRTLRMQAWERAKGELNSMLDTYWSGSCHPGDYEKASKALDEFINAIESRGLQE